MLPRQDYSNHLYCGQEVQDIWILSKSIFTLRLVSIVLLKLPFPARFVLPCTSLQLIQREYQGNPPDSGLQISVTQYSSIQVTFLSWGSSIHAHISKCWSSKAKHNRCFSPRSRFHEEGLFKRASLSILFPKPEQRKHIPTGISWVT